MSTSTKPTRRRTTSAPPAHSWEFRARLRRHAFGWRGSRLAIARINEALREIRKARKTDPVLAAEGAVLFIERVTPALEQIDSSTGALGSAVYRALNELAEIIAAAPADRDVRTRWLERIWRARVDDDMGYLDTVEDLWGDFCATPELAAAWAAEWIGNVRAHWQRRERGYMKGVTACLSAMFKAGQYREILDLLGADGAPPFWSDREWGFRSLAALGRRAEALRYADATNSINAKHEVARACEELLLASGQADEAYDRYAFAALREETTYAGTFRSMLKRYPHKAPETVLRDLATTTPGREGKWFAAAKDAGLYDEALRLANASPCDPMTLARAARDFAEALPEFALEASVASIRWMAQGYGYELTSLDAVKAYRVGLDAAQRLDRSDAFFARVKAIVIEGDPFVRGALRYDLGLPALSSARKNSPTRRRRPL